MPLEIEQDGALVTVFGDEDVNVQHTNALPMPDEEARLRDRAGALPPPYPPSWLALLYEESTSLRPAVEALEANVDGHGHRFEPLFDPGGKNARDLVRDSIIFERIHADGGLKRSAPITGNLLPTDLEIDLRMAEVHLRMRIERLRLDALFSACCPGSDLVRLRKNLRRDLEVTGNAYLGVRRDRAGNVAEFEYLPSVAMRLRPTVTDERGETLWVPVEVPVRVTPISIEYTTTHRSFRTFVQIGVARSVFFKEFGDPRLFSSRTGHMVASEEELAPGDRPATEVIHLRIHSSLYEYGVPRWIATAPVAVGLRSSQEVNADHFDNNGIPRMIFLISGGALAAGADEKLKTLLQAHCKGRGNYGSCVILQATPATTNPNARVTIEAKPLKEAIPDDGLFLNYGARCRDEVLSQFRLPKFVVGQLEDVNRSTAREGLAFVEDQVFQPMRYEFDVEMNALLQSEGFLHWKFVSNSPVSRDPETAARIVAALAKDGGLTVNDVRRQATEITNTPHPPITDSWANLPYELAKLAFAPPPGGPVSTTIQRPGPAGAEPTEKAAAQVESVSSPEALVDYLLRARDALLRGEKRAFAAEFETEKGKTLVLPMTGDDLAELVDFAAPSPPA